MKFSEQWLREWVNPPVTADELAEQLTMAGLEVDSVTPVAGDFSGVVVGEVVSVGPHPDADKLRVCTVNVGAEPLQIVCGAPNVQVGMKVPTALIGAVLPGDFRIKKSKLRGMESFGMLCSARELGLSEEAAGLMALPGDAPVGSDIRAYLDLDDRCIEVDLTPNRGDCLGMAGIAREIGVLNRCAVTGPAMAPVPASIEDTFPVRVSAPEACPRYLGRVLRGIDPKATTPLWMQEKLRRGGIRSLGPVVDVTNYVLLELGQPMHAFDLARLSGGIEVRLAHAGEQITLLDEKVIKLDTDSLLIADADKPLALAGIMGGAGSGVSDRTDSLFLECAFFAPTRIAGRARRYGLHTDSSHRFERGVDYQLQHRALERATALLLELVGGQAGPVIEVSSEAHLPRVAPIALRAARLQRLLGLRPDDATVEDILTRLGMEVQAGEGGWQVIPPSFRFDITLEADLIEEIGRVYGYNRLPSSAFQAALVMRPAPEDRVPLRRLRDLLVSRGYQEAVTYSFVDPEIQGLVTPDLVPVPLANPISSELSVMRTSLWQGLLRTLQHNLNRQQKRVRIFEHGLNYIQQDNELKQENYIGGLVSGAWVEEQWGEPERLADFFDVKADVEALLALGGQADAYRFAPGSHPALHPGQAAEILRDGKRVGWLGCVHPELARRLDIESKTFLFELHSATVAQGSAASFREISRFPSVRRDLAIVVDEAVSALALQEAIRETCGDQLLELALFDVYRGKGVEKGRKSIAFGLILQESSRTLTDADVESVAVRVVDRLNQNFGATLRD
jgi:phenylalanyl-tRNA synthetase beta chain